MNPARTYELSFVSKGESKSCVPEIVVSIPVQNTQRFKEAISAVVADSDATEIEALLGRGQNIEFVFAKAGRYGFGGCCRFEEGTRGLVLAFELYDFFVYHTALTLHILFHTLNRTLSDSVGGRDRKNEQSILVGTACRKGTLGGYAVSGRVFSVFGEWLVAQGTSRRKLAQVQNAMQEGWRALSSSTSIEYAKECSVRIERDGRFILRCFGDACDLSVYPDALFGEETLKDSVVEFSSHNIDTPVQQLTLIVGLATLLTLARKEHEVT